MITLEFISLRRMSVEEELSAILLRELSKEIAKEMSAARSAKEKKS